MGANPSTSTDATTAELVLGDKCHINHPPIRTAYEWHINDKYDSALKKASQFRSQYENLYGQRHWTIRLLSRSNAILKDSIYAFRKGYLNDIKQDKSDITWKRISEDLKIASAENVPVDVLKAYTRSQDLTRIINTDMARNTYHQFTLYCTPLNCNVLARTQDGIQAFVTILFHPDLNEYVCHGDMTVYRGTSIKNESVLKGYEEGSIIISATFLSTSRNRSVAEMFSGSQTQGTNNISLLWTYHLHNDRRTAMDIKRFSVYPEEEEVLIYPYVAFKILSFVEKEFELTGGKRIEITLEQVSNDSNGNSHQQSITVASPEPCDIVHAVRRQ